MPLDVMSKPSQNGIVEMFYLPVGLMIIRCGKVLRNTHEVAHRFEELEAKLQPLSVNR